MKYYSREDLLTIINRAEIVSFVAQALLIEFQKPSVENWDNVSLDLTNCRAVSEEEIAIALTDYAKKNGLEIHFPHYGYADCWLYQGILHEGPGHIIRVTVTNDSNRGMGSTSIIHITATLESK